MSTKIITIFNQILVHLVWFVFYGPRVHIRCSFKYVLLTYSKKIFTETYLFACTSTWYISTTAALLLMPVLFETERVQMEEAQKSHSKQVCIILCLCHKFICYIIFVFILAASRSWQCRW